MKTRTSKQERYFKKYFKDNNFKFAETALDLVNEFHTATRKDGSEERSHLFEVLGFAIANFDGRLSHVELEKLIVASALHDLVEDYSDEVSFKYLKTLFPKDYIRSIKKVTKWSTFKKVEKDYNHYHGNISKDFISTIVKATDRLHNLNSCTAVFSPEKKLDYIKETEKYIIPNLKKLRKTRPELYSSVTFLIYNIKNQMTQLRYVIDLEKTTLELKNTIKGKDHSFLVENDNFQNLLKKEKIDSMDLFIISLFEEIDSAYDILSELKISKNMKYAIEEIFRENFKYQHLIKIFNSDFTLTYLEKRDFETLFKGIKVGEKRIKTKIFLENIGVKKQLKSFMTKLSFNENFSKFEDLNFQNILKKLEYVDIKYSNDFEIN